MRRLVAKGLRVLLTDPVTGAPLNAIDRISLAYGLSVAFVVIMEMIILSLGMGAGQ